MPRMTEPTLERILRGSGRDAALIIGNGIHRYGPSSQTNSWEGLLIELAHDAGIKIHQLPKGTTATEFFDVLELRAGSQAGVLARTFCDLIMRWRAMPHHERIVHWARARKAPVLTTNFDEVLSDAAGCAVVLPKRKGFTDFYPWECRFAHREVDNPCAEFGIWHINGMARYSRSVRLGLTHYMGSVQRARGWIYSGEHRLFGGKDSANWKGRYSWLHIIFNKPLLFLGLGLQENEVFLRWLLIERARYFAKFPKRAQKAWYLHRPDVEDSAEAGKHFFLEELGIRCIRVADYREIYENPGWSMP